MVSRDYTKEVGLKPAAKRIPWPVAAIVLAGCGVAVWVGVMKLHNHEKVVKQRAHAAAAPAPATPPTAQ